VHGYTTAFFWAAGIFVVGSMICSVLLTSSSRAAGVAAAAEPALAHG
jgi:hypothetical protein